MIFFKFVLQVLDNDCRGQGYGWVWSLGFICIFFVSFVYCHVTLFCFFRQPVMVSCLRCKNLWISMTLPIVFLFTLGKSFMVYSHIGVPCHGTLITKNLLFLVSDHTQSYRLLLQSSSGTLSLTFDNSLVPNLCIGNKEKGLNISHFSINIYFSIF